MSQITELLLEVLRNDPHQPAIAVRIGVQELALFSYPKVERHYLPAQGRQDPIDGGVG
jgi:hypothetical protein